MNIANVEGIENAISVFIYDLSIKSPAERKEKRLEFHSKAKAANYLGCVPTTLNKYTYVGKRYYSEKHKKEFAIRINHERRNSSTVQG